MNGHLTAALAVVIAVAMFFGYINPTLNGAIADTNAAIAKDDQSIATVNKFVAEENQLASKRDAINPQSLAALKTFLPDSVDNVSTILDLDALAARTGLAIQNIDVAAASRSSQSGSLPTSAAGNPVGSVDLTMAASGSFSALQAFLHGVEQSARLLDLRSLTVQGSDTGGVYKYQMTIRLYWLR
jgi:hypothetical protein